MELTHSKEIIKKTTYSDIWFRKYTESSEITFERPYCFFYYGNIPELNELKNYSLRERSETLTLGIRKDLECLGFSFDRFIQLSKVEKFSSELIKEEVTFLINEKSEQTETAYSREDEIAILSEFFNY